MYLYRDGGRRGGKGDHSAHLELSVAVPVVREDRLEDLATTAGGGGRHGIGIGIEIEIGTGIGTVISSRIGLGLGLGLSQKGHFVFSFSFSFIWLFRCRSACFVLRGEVGLVGGTSVAPWHEISALASI